MDHQKDGYPPGIRLFTLFRGIELRTTVTNGLRLPPYPGASRSVISERPWARKAGTRASILRWITKKTDTHRVSVFLHYSGESNSGQRLTNGLRLPPYPGASRSVISECPWARKAGTRASLRQPRTKSGRSAVSRAPQIFRAPPTAVEKSRGAVFLRWITKKASTRWVLAFLIVFSKSNSGQR